MNDDGEVSGTRSDRGSAVLGLVQSFGIYALALGVLVAASASRTGLAPGAGTLFEVLAGAAFALSLALGVWQGRQGRVRTATGTIVGTFLWPAVALALAVWAVIHALSHATIPF